MKNHFRTGIEKLSDEELNAVVSPLLAILRAVADDGADLDAAIEFADRYEQALGVNDRTVVPMTANGTRFTGDDEGTAEDGDEVVGFGHRPELGGQAWRDFAGSLTGGRIGSNWSPNRTQSTVISLAPGAAAQLRKGSS